MTDKKQPEALRLAALIEKTGARGSLRDQAAVELRRLHAENETLRTGYEAARLEIESLRGKRWQPIATAPEDGTCVLVYPPTWDGRGCSMAQYESDKYATKPRPYWSRDDAFGKVGYSRNKPPTHWMPLPAGPADGESNELC